MSAAKPTHPVHDPRSHELHEHEPPIWARPLPPSVRRHVTGVHTIDEWGLDADWLTVVGALSRFRWSISVGGAEHVPEEGPALLVANRRPLAGTGPILALGIHRATGRVARPTGLPDVAFIGPTLRRLGAVLSGQHEIASLLRADQLPVVWCRPEWRVSGRVGFVEPADVAPAIAGDAPVIPVAVLAQPWSLAARVEVGPPLTTRRRKGPLGPAELADAARTAIQRLVDEANPPLWPLPG